MAKFEIERIKPHIGAIVHADKAELCEPEVVAACKQALEEQGVLLFPRVHLNDREQLAFTDSLGERINYNRQAPGTDAEEADVYTITLDEDKNDRPEYVLGTYFWHIDGVTTDIPLPKATLLSARKLSERGGQTEFASTYAAYEQLPDWEKEQIEGLRVLHCLEASMRPLYEELSREDRARWSGMSSRREHPLIWTHASGRKSLLIGTHADRIVDMPLADGRAILNRLSEWAAQPDFRYTHAWEEGDLVIWDNHGVMHRVLPYDAKSGRTMHRTTLAGYEQVA